MTTASRIPAFGTSHHTGYIAYGESSALLLSLRSLLQEDNSIVASKARHPSWISRCCPLDIHDHRMLVCARVYPTSAFTTGIRLRNDDMDHNRRQPVQLCVPTERDCYLMPSNSRRISIPWQGAVSRIVQGG